MWEWGLCRVPTSPIYQFSGPCNCPVEVLQESTASIYRETYSGLEMNIVISGLSVTFRTAIAVGPAVKSAKLSSPLRTEHGQPTPAPTPIQQFRRTSK